MSERLGGDPPSPWEERYGYSRMVRTGAFVLVGGITSVGPGEAIIGETPYEQTVHILGKLAHELGRVGVGLADVVQARIYVTDISRADDVGRAIGEAFKDVRPIITMVQVSALIDPRMLVEIEAVAVTA